MKTTILVIVLFVGAAGCVVAPPAQQSLTEAELNSQATQQAVTVARQQTQSAVDAQNYALAQADAMATQQVQQTQQAVDNEIALQNAENAAQQTQVAIRATDSALSIQGTATISAINGAATATQSAQSTMLAIQADQERFNAQSTQVAVMIEQKTAEDRAEMLAITMWVDAVLKSVLVVAALVFIAFLIYRLVKAKTDRMAAYQADAHGRYPVIRVGGLLVDINRSLHPVIDVAGEVPPAPGVDDQMRVTENDQRINLAWAAASGAPQPQIANFSRQQYQIVGSGDRPPAHLLGDVASTLDADWSEE